MATHDTATRPSAPPPAAGVIPIEQTVYRRADGEAPSLLRRSPGFADDWLPAAEALVRGFGERPSGVACPTAVFARPLGKQHVAVVQVADLEPGEASQTVALGFRVLVLPRAAYTAYLGDPFALADRFPPPWGDPGPLPPLTLPAEPLPPRTVEDVQRILQRVKAHALAEDQEPPPAEDEPRLARDEALTAETAESPALLGGVQVLVDGGRVVFERPGPDTGLIRGLWTLLPTRTRGELWPASFAFGNALGFDALIVRRAEGPEFAGYTSEDQAAEYPPGNYELRLQVAAESRDQEELNALLGRRSGKETWRLGLMIFGFLAVVVLVLHLTDTTREPPKSTGLLRPGQVQRLTAAATVVASGDPVRTLSLVHADWAGRLERVGVAAAVVTSADPFNALNLLHIGFTKWGKARNPR